MNLLVALCLMAVVAAAPPPTTYNSNEDVQLLRYDNKDQGRGNYKFGYEQSDGTRHDQQGELKNEGQDNEFVAVKGSFSWVGPDGVRYVVNYIADENGYQPEIDEGPGIGIPPAILASLLAR